MRSEEGAAARAPPSERCWNRNPNDTGMPASNWGDGSLCSSVPYTEMPSRWWRDAATSTSGRSSVSGGALESRCSTALESSISPVACAGALAAAIGQASRSTHAHQKRRGEERRGEGGVQGNKAKPSRLVVSKREEERGRRRPRRARKTTAGEERSQASWSPLETPPASGAVGPAHNYLLFSFFAIN